MGTISQIHLPFLKCLYHIRSKNFMGQDKNYRKIEPHNRYFGISSLHTSTIQNKRKSLQIQPRQPMCLYFENKQEL